MSFRSMSNLKQRLAVSSIGLVLLFIVLYFSDNPVFRPLFSLFLASAIGFALWEYYQIAIAKKFAPLVNLAIFCSTAYVFSIFWITQHEEFLILPEIVFVCTLLIFSSYYLFKDNNPLVNLAITVFGIIYLTLPLSLMLNINYFFENNTPQDGRWWLFYLLCVTKMTDTGAYLTGKKFGTRKLAPHISPKKTIEGAMGGLLFSLATSFLFFWLSIAYPETVSIKVTLAETLVLGVLIGVIGQIGDLVESLLKRDGGVKDSNQLPGLGGMLDIVDSLVFTTPLIYFFLKIKG